MKMQSPSKIYYLAGSDTNSRSRIWLISHYPVWDLEDEKGNACPPDEPRTVFDALRETIGKLLLSDMVSVDAVVAGDIHQQQFLKIVSGNKDVSGLTQYVAGHGGAKPGTISNKPDKFELKDYGEINCIKVSGKVYALTDQPIPVGGDEALAVTGRVGCAYGFLLAELKNEVWDLSTYLVAPEPAPPDPGSAPLSRVLTLTTTKEGPEDLRVGEQIPLRAYDPTLAHMTPS